VFAYGLPIGAALVIAAAQAIAEKGTAAVGKYAAR
jgi:hypothetical protein